MAFQREVEVLIETYWNVKFSRSWQLSDQCDEY